eukprot:762760-Hanusia_phi.AAC.5
MLFTDLVPEADLRDLFSSRFVYSAGQAPGVQAGKECTSAPGQLKPLHPRHLEHHAHKQNMHQVKGCKNIRGKPLIHILIASTRHGNNACTKLPLAPLTSGPSVVDSNLLSLLSKQSPQGDTRHTFLSPQQQVRRRECLGNRSSQHNWWTPPSFGTDLDADVLATLVDDRVGELIQL